MIREAAQGRRATGRPNGHPVLGSAGPIRHPGRERGFGLVEVLVALTVLSAGLIAAAGLTRAVARLAHEGRAAGAAALLAQQGLEAALAGFPSDPSARRDTLRYGDRDYALVRRLERSDSGLERIEVAVRTLGPVGYGSGEPRPRTYATYRWRLRPPPVPPRVAPP